jgi:murein DD-endopeptidase MepM/ murein hydrolase activator NlpD
LPPQSKELACGDVGVGAMVDIRDITREVDICTHWSFPLSINACTGIPVTPHPGAFKAVRRDNHIHTGVDLYADEGSEIRACERGRVVSIEPFTGPKDNSPWWKDTDAILIEGASGVICYGELKPAENLKVGSVVGRHQLIGTVKRVILEGKERPEITGWKPSMLHMELYPHGTTKASDGYINIREFLQDPTPYLLKSDYRAWAARPLKPLTWEKPNE